MNKTIDIITCTLYTLIRFKILNGKKGGKAMAFDYSKLNGRIVEKCGSQGNFARQMELSERSISLKLNNKTSWKQLEIQKALEVLGLKTNQIKDYFFVPKVQNI